MELKLYKYDGEVNTIGKILPTATLDLQGSLREGTSILSPSILIESTNYQRIVTDDKRVVGYLKNGVFKKVTHNTLEHLLECNYCYIPEFKRYYWVNNITSVRTNMWRLDMKVDVLNSYAEEIKHSTLYVLRQEKQYVMGIDDNMLNSYLVPKIVEYEPTLLGGQNIEFNVQYHDSSYNGAITTQCNITRNTLFPKCEAISMLPTTSSFFNRNLFYETFGMSIGNLVQLGEYIMQYASNYVDGIISIVIFPFNIPDIGGSNEVPLIIKDKEFDKIKVKWLFFKTYTRLILGDFIIHTPTDFNTNSYNKTKVELFIPYVGWVSLNPYEVFEKELYVTFDVNYTTGSATCNIVDVYNNKLLFSTNCQLGIKVPVGTSNQYEVDKTKMLNGINLALSLETSALSMATLTPVGVSMGFANGVNAIKNYISTDVSNYLKVSGQVTDANNGVSMPQKLRVKITYPEVLESYNSVDFNHNYGMPLNKYRLVSTLNGYTLFGDVNIGSLGTATKTELDEIKQKLESGVYIN